MYLTYINRHCYKVVRKGVVMAYLITDNKKHILVDTNFYDIRLNIDYKQPLFTQLVQLTIEANDRLIKASASYLDHYNRG